MEISTEMSLWRHGDFQLNRVEIGFVREAAEKEHSQGCRMVAALKPLILGLLGWDLVTIFKVQILPVGCLNHRFLSLVL